MPKTIRVFYSKAHNLKGRCRMNFNWPPISQNSVVLISAAEAMPQDPHTIAPVFAFNLGDADVYVTNVSPHAGGVGFILHVGWASPLDVIVDISVFDPPEQTFVA